MQKKVIVQILGRQIYTEGHDDQQSYTAEGMYYERNNAWYVVYKEPAADGPQEVTTFLTVKKDYVTVNRKGGIDTIQEFRTGVRRDSIYSTQFGKMWLSVMPQRVESDLTAQEGRISLEYDLFVDDNFVSHNLLLVTIKEDTPQ